MLNRTYEIGMAEISIREQCGLLAHSPLARGCLTEEYKNKQSTGAPTNETDSHENFGPAEALGDNEDFASVSGIQTTQDGVPSPCTKKDVVDPAQLLPKNSNSAWAKLNPKADVDDEYLGKEPFFKNK